MRKLSLILLSLFIVAGFAMAEEMSYPDVTVSGSVQQAWGFGDSAYSDFEGDTSSEIDVVFTAMVDAVNTAVIKFENGPVVVGTDGLEEELVEIDDAYFDTDLAAALGLDGVILQTRVGYWAVNNFNVSTVTGLEFENVVDVDTQYSAIQFEAGLTDLFTARFVIAPGDGDAMDGVAAVKGGYGPITAEVFYSDKGGQEPGSGELGVGVVFSQELVPGVVDLSAGADFAYELDAADGASDIFYGVGASAGLLGGLSTVGVSFKGQSEAAAEALGFDINLAPVPFAGLDIAVALGLDSDLYDETLQYSEFSAYLKPGAAEFRIGYAFYDGPKVVDADGDSLLYDDYNAGGFISTAESGFMFINTSVSF